MTQAKCDNCGFVCDEDDLNIPKRLYERLTPGGKVPSGECPECGALSYPIEEPSWLLPFEYCPRQPLEPDCPDGYMESDKDYLLNNRFLAVALLDEYAAKLKVR